MFWRTMIEFISKIKNLNMNTKCYFTVILIIAMFFLLPFYVKSQSVSDTITVVEKRIGVNYYYFEGELLNFNQLQNLTQENKATSLLMQQAYHLRLASICLYVPSAFCLGFSVGCLIAEVISDEIIKSNKIFFVSVGAGVGLLISGGICEIIANAKILKGVKVFNHSTKHNNNLNLNVGLVTNGVKLQLNF